MPQQKQERSTVGAVRVQAKALQRRTTRRTRAVVRGAAAAVPQKNDVRRAAGLSHQDRAQEAETLVQQCEGQVSDTGDQRARSAQFERALTAVLRAQPEVDEDTLQDWADRLHSAAEKGLAQRGVTPSTYGRQADPRNQALQRVHDETQLVRDRVEVADSREVFLDEYTRTAVAGRFTKLGNRMAFQTAGPAPDSSALDLAPGAADTAGVFRGRSYRDAVEYWLSDPDVDPDDAYDALNVLQKMDSPTYQAIVAELGDAYAAQHGLHEGERAAISTYTNEDYQYMNASRAGNGGWLGANVARLNPGLHGDDKEWTDQQKKDRASLAERLQRRAEKRDRASDKAHAKHQTAQGKTAAAMPGRKRPQDDAEVLKAVREADLNQYRQQGALHTAVAESALRKLPVYSGMLYRKDFLSEERVKQLFHVKKLWRDATTNEEKADLAFKSNPTSYPYLVSGSRSRKMSAGWTAGKTLLDTEVLYELKVEDARDVGRLSVRSYEVEAVLLPGTRVKFDSVEVTKVNRPGLIAKNDNTPAYTIVAKGHQVRSKGRL